MQKSFLPPDLFLWTQYSTFRVILFCIISIGIFARWGGWQWRPLVVCFMIWSIIFWRSYRRWWVISMLILWAIIGSSIIWIERWSESLAVILYYSMCATVIVWLFEWSKISVFSTKLWWWLDNKLDSLSKRSIEWIDRWYQQIIQKHTTISLILNHINNNSLAYAGGILLLLIRWPLLDRGWYLHMLDFTTTKHIFRSDVTTLRWFFLKITSFIVPTRIGEKILRIGWFVIGWKGIVECCRILNIQSKWIHRYALCLLWINPFVYARSVDGQINVVFIAMVLPWLFFTLVQWYQTRKRQSIRDSIIVELLLWVVSPHGFIIGMWVLLAFLVIFAFMRDTTNVSINTRATKRWMRYHAQIVLIILWAIGVNLFWIIPAMVDSSNTINSLINQVNEFHLKAYETHNFLWSITFNPLALVWYRWEIRQRFSVHTGKYWWLSYFIVPLWILAIIGIKKIKKYHKPIGVWLIVSIIVAWIAAQWVNYISLFSEFNSRLMELLPPLKWMRDAHKRTAWILVALIITSSRGLRSIFSSKRLQSIIYIARLIPFFYTPMMIRGMNNQVTSTPYPPSWNKIITTIQQEGGKPWVCKSSKQCYDILVLPRHSYMYFRHAQRITATPMYSFVYPYRARVANNVEFNNEYYTQSPWWLDEIDVFLWYPHGWWRKIAWSLSWWVLPPESWWVELLQSFVWSLKSNHHVPLILLLKESDYTNYLSLMEQLQKQWLIEISLENDDYILYKIK